MYTSDYNIRLCKYSVIFLNYEITVQRRILYKKKYSVFPLSQDWSLNIANYWTSKQYK